MSRSDLDTDTNNALGASTVMPIILFHAAFDEGDVRFWSGFGELTYDSQTWTGTGNFGGVSEFEESSAVQANGATVSLTGIPSEIISLALTYEYRDRPCTLYVGAIDASDGTVIGTFTQIAGRMDTMSWEDSGETGSISINIESILVDLQRPKQRRYTHEDQQIDYAGDLGLEYVAGMQDKQVPWGIATPSTAASSGASGNTTSYAR